MGLDAYPGDRTAPVRLSRAPGEELARLIDQLWSRPHQEQVVVTDGPPPSGYRVAERYRVVPSLESAVMLLPGGRRGVAARALIHYNRLRGPMNRLRRVVASHVVRTNMAFWGDRLDVCVPERVAADEQADLLAVSHIRRLLDNKHLEAAIGLTNPGPNRKPTLQLFDSSGQPVVFVKVGHNSLTRGMVDNEAAALHALAADTASSLRHPTLLLHEAWHGVTLCGTKPLPLDLRPQSSRKIPTAEAVSRAGGETTTVGLRESAYWTSVLSRFDALASTTADTAGELGVIRDVLEQRERAYAHAHFDFAPWHGDWVRWNMARNKDGLWVWDWEHYASSAPVGMDEMHYLFQMDFVHRAYDVATTMERVQNRITAVLRDRASHRQIALLVDVYLLELYLRAADMHAHGAGWNPRFHDDAVRWLARSIR